ncbi:MAG: carbamoyltransferase HypF [Sedimentisphaerales bacterium]|nr:carbamoyltransferase HypF [Sedimentisphaerales bacterium]
MVQGQVQGVGFRPFVHHLAGRLGLTGSVANTTDGAAIKVQGQAEQLDRFIELLVREAPRLARPVVTLVKSLAVVDGEMDFHIQASLMSADRKALVTPDAATCPDCLRELNDPADRRYRYPFINCTNCGPRYTITFDIPYDRPNTTMGRFEMCPDCRREYEDPANRRFHAQPNACPVCGPKVWLENTDGKRLAEADEAVRQAVRRLEQGEIVAVKGLGGFHLAVRADRDEAVECLRQRKYRKAKAFALMVRDITTARRVAQIGPAEQALLEGVERPIVLCYKLSDAPVSEQVAPRSRWQGVMLPYTPLHHLLMEGDYPALVMTSGNNSDEPIETSNTGGREHLGAIVDVLLLHDRPIYTSCDDSVVRVYDGEPMMLRRARGYAPQPLFLKRRSNKNILAVGAELKNTVTFIKGENVFVSQHIGDLKTAPTHEAFLRTIDKLGALIDARPDIVACDLHPAMLSTQQAQSYAGVRLVPVQHHHAHAAAVMGEYNLEEPVVAIMADGVGYGTDGRVWGCEILTAWRNRFERRAHLEPVAMPGGDAASWEPWRMAVSYLLQALGPDEGAKRARSLLSMIDVADIETVATMVKQGFNCPMTTSLGRLFDAVSALLNVCTHNTYNAQAAVELEYIAGETITPLSYAINVDSASPVHILRTQSMIQQIVADMDRNVGPKEIAAGFHAAVIDGLYRSADMTAQQDGIKTIVLGGGVFHNDILLSGLHRKLQQNGYGVYFNRQIPVNDGAISFGQAVVADAINDN